MDLPAPELEDMKRFLLPSLSESFILTEVNEQCEETLRALAKDERFFLSTEPHFKVSCENVPL